MWQRFSKFVMLSLVVMLCLTLVSAAAAAYNVAVLFPGSLGGNPLAAGIEAGVERANRLPNVSVRLIESPVTSRWEQDLTTLAATGTYDLVVTFTSGMAPIVPKVASQFPNQKFALLDSEVTGILNNVVSLVYSDRELGFLAGVFAGLVAQEASLGGGSGTSVGLISGDTYPQMDFHIKPGFIAGVHFVNPRAQVRYAVIGNWADPITANGSRRTCTRPAHRSSSPSPAEAARGSSTQPRAPGSTRSGLTPIKTLRLRARSWRVSSRESTTASSPSSSRPGVRPAPLRYRRVSGHGRRGD